jgi:hypothetical protein
MSSLLLRSLGTVAFGLGALVGCAAPATESDADLGGADDEVRSVPTAAAADSLTHFESGDVDLTKYAKAGAAEWKAFESVYRERHTDKKESDDLELLKGRVTKAVGERANITSYVALKGYTLEVFRFNTSSPPVTQDYREINRALRDVEADPKSADAKRTLAKWEGYIKSAASAVNEMPKVTSAVHRRVFRSKCDEACIDEFIKSYVVGQFFSEPSFMSTSEIEKSTCGFRGQIHFVIKANGLAHSVKSISDFPSEAEAMFPPGAVFKVDKITRDVPSTCGANDEWFQFNTSERPPTKETIIELSAVTR